MMTLDLELKKLDVNGAGCACNAAKDEPRMAPRVAAVDLLDDFKRLARALCPTEDRATRDDLVQEMCLATVRCRRERTASFFISKAMWAAKAWLRWWILEIEMREEHREELRERARRLHNARQ